ncbi:aminodeoxychorismate lyase [Halalkalibacter oceani]|uniref:aminodeoxychorismate lyase n=1 Tax=Halalkalibacter oceani TaxID=1653776 RepID=UPI00339A96BF
MFIYLNGKIVDQAEANISAFDHGYMYGLGLFETFRVDGGHPFLLDDHFLRLHAGLQTLAIEWRMEREEALTILSNLLRANQLKNAYVRWNVSAGPAEIGLPTGRYEQPTVIVYMKPLPPVKAQLKDAVLLQIRRNTPEGEVRLKSHHYLNNVLAKRELGDSPDQEGIFLTEEGLVAEGVVSNVFWIKKGVVYTPALQTGILDGITRQFVLALLEQWRIPVEVGCYKAEALLEADAAFVTNSIQEVVPLRSCGQQTYQTDLPLIRKLSDAFQHYRQRLWSRDELNGGST